MVCYLVRHGKDDETVRGGWSKQPLTTEGVQQAKFLSEFVYSNMDVFAIRHIYSSDLPRTIQTAQAIADKMNLPVLPLPQFREVNNGELAGMKNSLALERYPGLFWNQLEWEQCYPKGESPKQFYERISTAWVEFSQKILSQKENVMLVTHSGVINVIMSIINGKQYSNIQKHRPIAHTEIIPLVYQNSAWKELKID